MRNPIYRPSGAAAEYGKYALNIYTGCPHRCFYCYVPGVLHCDREAFHSHVEPRPGILEATEKQLERTGMTGETIFLCFSCDPYPTGYDSSMTREIIKLLKGYGNHVCILTKGDGTRDFNLLDSDDWYGITCDGGARRVYPAETDGFKHLIEARKHGIKTWVSFEPVIDPEAVLTRLHFANRYADRVKIGKLNHTRSAYPIDWAAFGREAEALCQSMGLDYYIKDSLRKEMERR